eukprot:TRINITY_DN2120_c0_g1_i1.p1 TRINITY_DN2120_c0_g1~~TRINITY_DN2120_c0_g1_i1.p1  ORF type:complete len:970 (-),score=238.75 TRINITY_DN2120_c0_g1_i1:89-2998(-)
MATELQNTNNGSNEALMQIDEQVERRRLQIIRKRLAQQRWAANSDTDDSTTTDNDSTSASEDDRSPRRFLLNDDNDTTPNNNNSNGHNTHETRSIEDLLRKYYPDSLHKLHQSNELYPPAPHPSPQLLAPPSNNTPLASPQRRRGSNDDGSGVRRLRSEECIRSATATAATDTSSGTTALSYSAVGSPTRKSKKERRLSLAFNKEPSKSQSQPQSHNLDTTTPTHNSHNNNSKKTKTSPDPSAVAKKRSSKEEKRERRKSAAGSRSHANVTHLSRGPGTVSGSPKRERRQIGSFEPLTTQHTSAAQHQTSTQQSSTSSIGHSVAFQTEQMDSSNSNLQNHLSENSTNSNSGKHKRKSRLSLNLRNIPSLISPSTSPHATSPRGHKSDRPSSPRDQESASEHAASKDTAGTSNHDNSSLSSSGNNSNKDNSDSPSNSKIGLKVSKEKKNSGNGSSSKKSSGSHIIDDITFNVPLLSPRRRKRGSNHHTSDESDGEKDQDKDQAQTPSKKKEKKKEKRKTKLRRHTRNITDQLKRPSGGLSLIIPSRSASATEGSGSSIGAPSAGTSGMGYGSGSPTESPRTITLPGTFIVRGKQVGRQPAFYGSYGNNADSKKVSKGGSQLVVEVASSPRNADDVATTEGGTKVGSRESRSRTGSKIGSGSAIGGGSRVQEDSPSLILGEWGQQQVSGNGSGGDSGVGGSEDNMIEMFLSVSYSDTMNAMYSREEMMKREEEHMRAVEQRRKALELEYETSRQRQEAMTDVSKKKKWGMLMALPSNVQHLKEDFISGVEGDLLSTKYPKDRSQTEDYGSPTVIDLSSEVELSSHLLRRRSRSIDDGIQQQQQQQQTPQQKPRSGTERGRRSKPVLSEKEREIRNQKLQQSPKTVKKSAKKRHARFPKQRSISKTLLLDPTEGDRLVAEREHAEHIRWKQLDAAAVMDALNVKNDGTVDEDEHLAQIMARQAATETSFGDL